MRKALFFLCLFIVSDPCAQSTAVEKKDQGIFSSRFPGSYQQAQVDQWNAQSAFFSNKAGAEKSDIDSAIALAQDVMELSRKIQYAKGFNQSLTALATAHIQKSRGTDAAYRLMNLADDTTKVDILMELHRFYFTGNQLQQNEDSAMACLNKAIQFTQSPRDVVWELNLRRKALVNFIQENRSDLVGQQLAAVAKIRQHADQKALLLFYYAICNFLYKKGDLPLSLEIALDGLNISAKENNFIIERLYAIIGMVYKDLKEYEKALSYLQKAFALNKTNGNTGEIWILCEWICHSLALSNRKKESLDFVLQTRRTTQFSRLKDSIMYYRTLGYCYQKVSMLQESEQAYWEMLRLSEKNQQPDAVTFNRLARIFYDLDDYPTARSYARRVLAGIERRPQTDQDAYHILFRIDTSTGNYRSAVGNLLRERKIQESIRKIERENNIRQLMIQFETEKKDKDIVMQRQAIELLTQKGRLRETDLENTRLRLQYETESRERNQQLALIDAAEKDKSIQLQQQNISLLEKDALLKKAAISKASLTRDLSAGGVALLLTIILLLYNRYRLKRQSSLELARRNQQLEILIAEKELLVKEVHHRVKNNLHTIISLLESQASFLTNDALSAIQKSQNRVYAMSLVHHKLYQQDNVTSIKMDIYFNELLDHLESSFETKGQIQVQRRIESIEMDISQAIPLGVILNEAVTNAIKYAFPSQETCAIVVSLSMMTPDQARLSITDNGVGLPSGWEAKLNQSLGVKLMRGLSEEIQGKCQIRSGEGTTVEVHFSLVKYTKSKW